MITIMIMIMIMIIIIINGGSMKLGLDGSLILDTNLSV